MNVFRIIIIFGILTFLVACSQKMLDRQETLVANDNVTIDSDDYFMQWRKFDAPAVFITGVTGENPIGYVKICFENVFQDKSAFIQQRYSPFIENGGVVVTETNSALGNAFLCQIAYNKYQPKFATHHHSRLIEVDGPGIYYLGTINARSPGTSDEYYLPQVSTEVVGSLRETIAKVREKYNDIDLPLKNFSFDTVADNGTLPMEDLGKIIDIRAKQIADNKKSELKEKENQI